jgi:phospholipid transport system substrate-binding protein
MIKKIIALMLVFLCCAHSLWALQESEISSFMRSNIDLATSILRNAKLPKEEKSTKLFAIFDQVFDYTLMAQLAIGGKQWETLSAEKRQEFTRLFEMRLKTSYMEKLDLYTDEKIVIKNLEKIKDVRIHLTTHLMRGGEVYEIIYKFYKTPNNTWLIYDVDILGVSIIQTYRTQFADILSKEPFDKLMEKLKEPLTPSKEKHS